jgi:murein DD-endopeptidase MepM/ murein hydrolase activator NlpD
MSVRKGRRVAALLVAGSVAIGAIVVAANAQSSLEAAVQDRHEIGSRIVALHELRHARRVAIHKQIKVAQDRLHSLVSDPTSGKSQSNQPLRKTHTESIITLRARERTLVRTLRARIAALRQQRVSITSWIESLPLQACPVNGPTDVADNFGVLVDLPGVPKHIHQGNDMAAATGTPIVAPFDGNAVAEPNSLGGEAVKVYGSGGYVYNAHLSAYGKLGAVQTGDVIGYVGSTGDATAPHDHFEWHPGNGSAVDPHDLLMAVCSA